MLPNSWADPLHAAKPGHTGDKNSIYSFWARRHLALGAAVVCAVNAIPSPALAALTVTAPATVGVNEVAQVATTCGVSVPALGGLGFGLAALILAVGVWSLRCRSGWGVLVAGALCWFAPLEVDAQATGSCDEAQWSVTGAFESFSGSGSPFDFIPTRQGVYLVQATVGGDTGTAEVEVVAACSVDADCDDANSCTTDTCNQFGGCEHPGVSAGTVCADGVCDGQGECVSVCESCIRDEQQDLAYREFNAECNTDPLCVAVKECMLNDTSVNGQSCILGIPAECGCGIGADLLACETDVAFEPFGPCLDVIVAGLGEDFTPPDLIGNLSATEFPTGRAFAIADEATRVCTAECQF